MTADRVPRTLDCPTINLNPYDHNARPSQTDGRNIIVTIARRFVFVLTKALRANNKTLCQTNKLID